MFSTARFEPPVRCGTPSRNEARRQGSLSLRAPVGSHRRALLPTFWLFSLGLMEKPNDTTTRNDTELQESTCRAYGMALVRSEGDRGYGRCGVGWLCL